MKLTDIEVFQAAPHQPRADWEFRVDVAAIVIALEGRIDYHQRRNDFWETELAIAAGQLKENTKIVEQQITGGVQHVAQVDQIASQRVSQCEAKLAHHRTKLWEYTAWHWIFAQRQEASRQLSVADVMHFGIVTNPAEDD